MKLILILSCFSFYFAGCTAPVSTDGLLTSKSNNLTYTLSENGCSTGEHTFYSEEQMCNGLKNDSLNNNCAYNLRRLKFKSDCPGRTW